MRISSDDSTEDRRSDSPGSYREHFAFSPKSIILVQQDPAMVLWISKSKTFSQLRAIAYMHEAISASNGRKRGEEKRDATTEDWFEERVLDPYPFHLLPLLPSSLYHGSQECLQLSASLHAVWLICVTAAPEEYPLRFASCNVA